MVIPLRSNLVRRLLLAGTAAALFISSCSSPSLIGGSSPWCVAETLSAPAAAAPLEFTARAGGEVDGEEVTTDPDLRVVIYNIRSGFGPSGRPQPQEVLQNLRNIAASIAQSGDEPPDLVGLNEVDFRSRRSGFVDQAAFIARELARWGASYTVVRGPAWTRTERGREILYGNALLIRHPVTKTHSCLFDELEACGVSEPNPALRVPSAGMFWSWLSSEPRGVVVADFQWGDRGPVRAILTHLDPYSASIREAQAAQIVHHLVDVDHPVLLLGDMNAVPTRLTIDRQWFRADRTHDVLTSGRLFDIRRDLGGDDERQWMQWATYPAAAPRWPIDTVLASPSWVAKELQRLPDRLSDHLALVATLSMVEQPAQREARWKQHLELQKQRLHRIMSCDVAERDMPTLLQWLTHPHPVGVLSK